MKLIILPKGLSEDLLNKNLSQIESRELDNILDELKQIDKGFEISDINYGKGADWILILSVLSAISSVVAIGDKLEKGIDGWIKIGKRLNNIFKNSDRVYIDENGAKILAITNISKSYQIESITLIDQHIIFLEDFSTWFRQRNPDDFTSKPFNIYNFTFEVNNQRTICLSIKSNGEITQLLNIEKESLSPPF